MIHKCKASSYESASFTFYYYVDAFDASVRMPRIFKGVLSSNETIAWQQQLKVMRKLSLKAHKLNFFFFSWSLLKFFAEPNE